MSCAPGIKFFFSAPGPVLEPTFLFRTEGWFLSPPTPAAIRWRRPAAPPPVEVLRLPHASQAFASFSACSRPSPSRGPRGLASRLAFMASAFASRWSASRRGAGPPPSRRGLAVVLLLDHHAARRGLEAVALQARCRRAHESESCHACSSNLLLGYQSHG